MKTSTIGNVRVKTADMTRNVHNMSRNIYTSCGFGEVQPCSMLDCQQPGTQNIRNEFLCYLADVICPTYGHVNVNFWHYFVKYSDLFETYPRLMAQTKQFNSNPASGASSVPIDLPHMSHNVLSTLLLIGAHCSVYKVVSGLNDKRILEYVGWDGNPTSAQNASASAFYNSWLQDTSAWLRERTGNNALSGVSRVNNSTRARFGIGTGVDNYFIDVRLLIDNPNINTIPKSMKFPLSNPIPESFTEIDDGNGGIVTSHDGIDIAPVSIDGADFIIERKYATTTDPNRGTYVYAFRMHAFGKRLFKVFKGLEFQEDFTSIVPESLAPFFAYFKAYWNTFGIELYQNYDTTNCGILCKAYDSKFTDVNSFDTLYLVDYQNVAGWTYSDNDVYSVLYALPFFMDLGNTWFTDSQDYVSAQQRSVGVAPSVDQTFVDSVIGVAGNNSSGVIVPSSQGTATDSQSVFGANQHAYINLLNHGQLSAEMLQKLYKITNIKTLAGKRIRELLLAEGYGKWMDAQKCAFIGHDVEQVEFSQVISTADTDLASNGTGALVGSRGGRGQAYGNCKPHYYENDEPGLLISMCSVVPDSGYTQKMNTAFGCIEKYQFYQREFDGKGYEATKIKYINGERPVALLYNGNQVANDTERMFGVAPRMSKFKQVGNILSGHFAKRSTRKSFLPYNMDRFINVGETIVTDDEYLSASNVSTKHVEIAQVFPMSEFPLAGIHWRYPTRYPWLGHYTRIFANVGDDSEAVADILRSRAELRENWEIFSNEEDGFSLMITLSVRMRNAMLQIADSYEVTDDSNEGSTNHSMSKA